MRTVDLARAVGLSAQQVRNHEAWGFLPEVPRSASGYRLYTDRHLKALMTARTMISAYGGWQPALEIMRAVHGGDLDSALALVDERHAEIHQERRKIDAAVQAIRALLESAPEPGGRLWRRGPLRVGEAAKAVGVRPSALRFWEQQGLLQPGRDESSGYRLYDPRQMRRLEMVALLRGADYDFDTIRSMLKELAEGRPQAAMRAVEKRRGDIARTSRACAEATAALWEYVSRWASAGAEGSAQ